MKYISKIFTAILISTAFPGLSFGVVDNISSPTLVNEPAGIANILQIITYLILVILIIVGIAWVVRRYGKFNNVVNGDLKILAGLSIGQKEKLIVIQAGSSQLLLGIVPGSIKTLHVLDSPITTEDEESINQNTFLSKINDEIKKRKAS